jgi:hypothetical protein
LAYYTDIEEVNKRSEYDCHQGHGGEYWIVGLCAVQAAKRLEPNVFMLVLLPPLVYEAAANLDWHIFKRCLNNIAYLSFPGVVLFAFLVALLLQQIDDSWGFYQVASCSWVEWEGVCVCGGVEGY